jgi:ADP-ribosylglycohydrolase
VINHGKQDLWSPNLSIHYHATLQAGENTLEAQLARVLMKSIVANHGQFNAQHFRQAYIDFMTTPGSHNDTYASTCHRMFFANLVYRRLPPERCPDNDKHNVDTQDGLVLPTITALAVAARPDGTLQEASHQAAATAAVTRNSPVLQRYAAEWGGLIFQTVRAAATDTDTATAAATLRSAARQMAQNLGLRKPVVPRNGEEITACYLDSAVPAMLDGIVKYASQPVWEALLANANTGGENVHRGSCLGAVLGMVDQQQDLPPRLIQGLYQHEVIGQEIQSFVESVTTSAER